MKSIFATLAVAALTTAVHGLGCGPGTVHDLATDLCVAVEARVSASTFPHALLRT